MNAPNWENWAAGILQRRGLTEPPQHVLERAYAIATPRRRVPVWLASAALLVVTVTGALLLTSRRAPVLPTAPVDSGVRSGVVALIEPSGELEILPTLFSWEPVERAASYRLQLLAVDDTVLFEQTTAETSVELPDEIGASLHAAVTYAWEVEALDATGAIVARSQRARFTVRP